MNNSSRIPFLLFLFLFLPGSSHEVFAQSGKYPRYEFNQFGVGQSPMLQFDPIRSNSDRFLEWAVDDASAWVSSWDGQRVVYVAGATAGLVALTFTDESVSSWAKGLSEGPIEPLLDVANEFGGPVA
ncbi:MAG: hypothetical protein E2O84_03555, partial [Bacteroidetes bacterium]